jgi:glyoxylase-like metal-dependent hydrolase (beta-lactamase superfamily II)
MNDLLRWTIGDVRVTSVCESETPLEPNFLLAGATRDDIAPHSDWLRDWAITNGGRVVLRVHALVVESGSRRVVIDTCVGNDKERDVEFMDHLHTPFLDDLAAAGFARETIDTVVCTHLHSDHVGWNTMLVDGGWVPTFPNARYLIVRKEYEHWLSTQTPFGDIFGDSIRPVLDAGLVDFVDPWHLIAPDVMLEPTPGHTPGHVSVCIRSGADEAWITGDVLHHPLQCALPDMPSVSDDDAEAAEGMRRAMLSRWCDDGVLVIGTHFAAPCAGRLERNTAGYTFRALRA